MRILENPVVLIALIVLVIVLFGAKRLPDVAKSVGSSLKIFKKEVKDLRDDDTDDRSGTPQGGQAQQAPQQQPSSPATPSGEQPPSDGDHRAQQPGSQSASS